ncbi:Uncharacterised protein [Mycobacteroides abscessus subsp. abscessus]|nr:Uncharacterised protein [Mycobacteroides abscessus subsp. abscessus]
MVGGRLCLLGIRVAHLAGIGHREALGDRAIHILEGELLGMLERSCCVLGIIGDAVQDVPDLTTVIEFLIYLDLRRVVRLAIPAGGVIEHPVARVQRGVQGPRIVARRIGRLTQCVQIPATQLADGRAHQRGLSASKEVAVFSSWAVTLAAKVSTSPAMSENLRAIDDIALMPGDAVSRMAASTSLPAPVASSNADHGMSLMCSVSPNHAFEMPASSSVRTPNGSVMVPLR